MNSFLIENVDSINEAIFFKLIPSYYLIWIVIAYIYKINKKILLYIGISPLFLIVLMLGIRNDTGSDDGPYKDYFNEIASGLINYENNNFEIGYFIINKLVIMLGLNHHLIFLASSLFVYLGLIFYIKKINIKNYILIAFIYISFCLIGNHNSAVRSAFAIGIIYYASGIYHLNKNINVSLILGLVSSQFHIIGYIYLISILIHKYISSRKILINSIIIVILLPISYIIFNIYDVLIIFENKYYNYLVLESSTISYFFWIVFYSYFLLFFIYNRKKYNDIFDIYYPISILITQILLMMMFNNMYILWMRFSLITIPIILTYYIKINEIDNSKKSYIFFIIAFIYYFRTMSLNGYDLINYSIIKLDIY